MAKAAGPRRLGRRIGENGALFWVVMITSADNRMCTGDVAFGADDKSAGLPAPSVLRPLKIATIDVSRAEPVGTASPELVRGVLAKIKQSLRL